MCLGEDTLLSNCLLPISTQVYKWVPANLLLGVNLWWTSIPSRGELKYQYSSHFMLSKPGCIAPAYNIYLLILYSLFIFFATQLNILHIVICKLK